MSHFHIDDKHILLTLFKAPTDYKMCVFAADLLF